MTHDSPAFASAEAQVATVRDDPAARIALLERTLAGAFLSLRRVLPDRYPLEFDVDRYIADEQRLGRMLDYAVIVPRLQRLYDWSAKGARRTTSPGPRPRGQPGLRMVL